MSDFTLIATCANCGGMLFQLAPGKPVSGGLELQGMWKCENCHAHWLVTISKQIVQPYEVRPDVDVGQHGTHGGYVNGCRCDPCVEAQSAYDRARYKLRKARERAA